jgi:hypothetical protein
MTGTFVCDAEVQLTRQLEQRRMAEPVEPFQLDDGTVFRKIF